MSTKKENDALIRRMQKEESAEKVQRVERLIRGLRKHGAKLLHHELSLIEQAVHPAVGRVALD